MIQPVLFSQHSFTTKKDTIADKLKVSVANLRAADFANSSQESLAATLYQIYAVAGPSLDTEAITQAAPEELMVQVPNADAPNTPTLVPGRRFKFSVPFNGSSEWLQTILPDPPENLPHGFIQNGIISFSLQQPIDDPVETLVTAYNWNITGISDCIDVINTEIDNFNASLQQLINNLLSQRQAQINKNFTDAEAFGVPFD